jgi:hypothetical protein
MALATEPLDLLPHDTDGERNILAAAIGQPSCITDLMDTGLVPIDFYDTKLHRLFDVVLKMHNAGEPIDVLTVAQKAETTKTGWTRLDVLDLVETSYTTSGAAVKQARNTVNLATKRRAVDAATDMRVELAQPGADPLTIVPGYVDIFTEIVQPLTSDTASPKLITGAALLDEPEPLPPPVAMLLDEGGIILRAGRTYLLVGEAGIGKSLIAEAACIEAALGGHCALSLDWEDSARTYKVRVRALRVGLGERALDSASAEFLFYAPMVGESAVTVGKLVPEGCVLIVLDSVSRCMGAMGLDENSASDFHVFVARVLDVLRAAAPDAAIVLLDHPGHGDAKRGRGTSAKRPVVDVELTLERAGRGLRLVLQKDRHADFDAPVKATVAEIGIHPGEGGTATIHYRAPVATFTDDGTVRPTGLMTKVSRYLAEQTEPVSLNTIKNGVPGKADWVGKAAHVLAAEGYAKTENGPRGAVLFTHVRPYSEATDPKVTGSNNPVTGSQNAGMGREPVRESVP